MTDDRSLSRSDSELLAAHVAGDGEAFAEVFRRHRQRLWAVALRTAGNPEDAADALQDALISAFRRAGSFRGESSVSTWLHRIVVNACLDRIRRAKVRTMVPLEGATEAHSLEVDDPEASGERRALREALLDALRQLPADQRAAVVLVDVEGLPIAEVAQILGCAEGTVKSRCARGRARLLPLMQGWRGNLDRHSDVPSSDQDRRGPETEGGGADV
jgi:RNA polymerase sigma-70 factor (ECF subfamily)